MNYCGIHKTDIANGLGVRVSLFVSGCRNHCPGCFQPETWDFDFGEPFTRETEKEIMKALRPSWIQGLSILGGEPMEPENQKALLPFLKRVRRELPDKEIVGDPLSLSISCHIGPGALAITVTKKTEY